MTNWADDMDRDQEQHPERWGMVIDGEGNPVDAERARQADPVGLREALLDIAENMSHSERHGQAPERFDWCAACLARDALGLAECHVQPAALAHPHTAPEDDHAG